MKNTNNQIEYIKNDLNDKITALMYGQIIDGRIIGDINDLLFQNKSIAKFISPFIVTRALSESSSANKLRMLYVIDSVIKNKLISSDFLPFLAPQIFRIFEEAYSISDEDNKINLFKLYYSWKYFLDSNILDSLSSRFNFKEMKRVLSQTRPDIIEKYENYNESVLEGLKKEMALNKSINNINNISSSNIPSNEFVSIGNNNAYNTSTSTLTDLPTNTTNNLNPQPSSKNKNLNKSYLTKVIDPNSSRSKTTSNSHHKSSKRRRGDDLFSSGSSSPRISDDEVSSSVDRRRKPKKHKTRKDERVSQFADYFSKNDIEIKKKKPRQGETNYDNDFNYSSKSDTSIKSRVDNVPAENIPKEDKARNAMTNQQMLLNSLQNLNPQLATLLTSINQNPLFNQRINNLNTKYQQIPPMNQNPKAVNIPQQSKPIMQNPVENIIPSEPLVSDISEIHNPIHNFINISTSNLNSAPYFFSSISKFMNESLQNSSPIAELIRDTPNLRNKIEILKTRNLNSKEYQRFQDKVLNLISTDLRNACTLCGFRTRYYNKFVEHLDIHFHINYIKRSSQKKVLYRKESLDKSSWIRQGIDEFDSRRDNNAIRNSYTLNSVLFYQHDTDHMLSSKKDTNAIDNPEDNEQLIIPIQPEYESHCIYCGDEFKKRYINKFNYWFYINVIKFSKEELKSLNEILTLEDNSKTDFVLIHESCIEEYIKMLKSKESMHFLGEKRVREISNN